MVILQLEIGGFTDTRESRSKLLSSRRLDVYVEHEFTADNSGNKALSSILYAT